MRETNLPISYLSKEESDERKAINLINKPPVNKPLITPKFNKLFIHESYGNHGVCIMLIVAESAQEAKLFAIQYEEDKNNNITYGNMLNPEKILEIKAVPYSDKGVVYCTQTGQ